MPSEPLYQLIRRLGVESEDAEWLHDHGVLMGADARWLRVPDAVGNISTDKANQASEAEHAAYCLIRASEALCVTAAIQAGADFVRLRYPGETPEYQYEIRMDCEAVFMPTPAAALRALCDAKGGGK